MAIIKTENLKKIYESGDIKTPALQGVSFEIDAGEFVAIMGPSGSGKSTLLHILGFLDRQTHGQYFFDGRTIDDYSEDEIAHLRNKKMGFVFQMFNLLPRTTVLDNVKMPLLYSKVKKSLWENLALEAIELVGLSDRIHHQSSELSGGERQKVAIARALVNNPSVIFADEPTGNLDSGYTQKIIQTLKDLNKDLGHTVILITHEAYVAECADRIISIKDGKIESDKKNKQKNKKCQSLFA